MTVYTPWWLFVLLLIIKRRNVHLVKPGVINWPNADRDLHWHCSVGNEADKSKKYSNLIELNNTSKTNYITPSPHLTSVKDNIKHSRDSYQTHFEILQFLTLCKSKIKNRSCLPLIRRHSPAVLMDVIKYHKEECLRPEYQYFSQSPMGGKDTR